jgi:hypothetical protein
VHRKVLHDFWDLAPLRGLEQLVDEAPSDSPEGTKDDEAASDALPSDLPRRRQRDYVGELSSPGGAKES